MHQNMTCNAIVLKIQFIHLILFYYFNNINEKQQQQNAWRVFICAPLLCILLCKRWWFDFSFLYLFYCPQPNNCNWLWLTKEEETHNKSYTTTVCCCMLLPKNTALVCKYGNIEREIKKKSFIKLFSHWHVQSRSFIRSFVHSVYDYIYIFIFFSSCFVSLVVLHLIFLFIPFLSFVFLFGDLLLMFQFSLHFIFMHTFLLGSA